MNEVKEIILKGGHITLVDDEDYEILKSFKCHMSENAKNGHKYACCMINGRSHYMHRIIANAPRGMVVDHINRNSLDNQKHNLRVCTQMENTQNKRVSKNNKTGFKGVDFHRCKYRATIQIDGIKKHIGLFDTPQEAADAYDRTAVEHFGEFALTNKQINKGRLQTAKKG